jgi:hypothetical protein
LRTRIGLFRQPNPVDDNIPNGNLLQIMPWVTFSHMTDNDITAIYEYLSAIPCIDNSTSTPPAGAPNELRNDCGIKTRRRRRSGDQRMRCFLATSLIGLFSFVFFSTPVLCAIKGPYGLARVGDIRRRLPVHDDPNRYSFIDSRQWQRQHESHGFAHRRHIQRRLRAYRSTGHLAERNAAKRHGHGREHGRRHMIVTLTVFETTPSTVIEMAVLPLPASDADGG